MAEKATEVVVEEGKTQDEKISEAGEEIAHAEKVSGVEEQVAPDEPQVEPEMSAPAVGADQAVPVVAEAADEVQLAPAPVEEAVPAAATGEAVPAAATGPGKGIETLIEVVNNSAAPEAVDAGNGAQASVAAPVTAMQVAVAGSKQPKRRGRPPKPIPEGALSSIPKRRGRPPKKIEMEVKVAGVPPEASAPVEAAGAQPGEAQAPLPSTLSSSVPPRKRGRPKGEGGKKKGGGGKATDKTDGTPKKRGRKPKDGSSAKVKVTSAPGLKKRGRPKKSTDGGARPDADVILAKRAPVGKRKQGRPKKEGGGALVAKPKAAAAAGSGKRGRPKKVVGALKLVKTVVAPKLVKIKTSQAPIVGGEAIALLETEKRGRGRPAGSANGKGGKKVVEAIDLLLPKKRGRGRPPGSVNKKGKMVVVSSGSKKGRGRPKKKHTEAVAGAPDEVIAEGDVAPKKRGRPKKKPKAAVALLASGRLTAGDGAVVLPAKKRRLPKGEGEMVAAPEPAEDVVAPKKGRGRPKKGLAGGEGPEGKAVVKVSIPPENASEVSLEKEVGAAEMPSTKKRGRPPSKGKGKAIGAPRTPKEGAGPFKSGTAEVAGMSDDASVPAKKRGRPSKKVSGNGATGTVSIPTEVVAAPEESAVGKKRGRPRAPIKEDTAAEAAAPKKRGRPALADKDKAPAALPAKAAQKLVGVQLET